MRFALALFTLAAVTGFASAQCNGGQCNLLSRPKAAIARPVAPVVRVVAARVGVAAAARVVSAPVREGRLRLLGRR